MIQARAIALSDLTAIALQSIFEAAFEPIIVTDDQLDKPGPRIIYVNQAFTAVTGYTAEEVLGKTPRILQGPRTSRSELDRLRAEVGSGQSSTGQAINYRKDGSEYLCEWRIIPVTSPSGTRQLVNVQRVLGGTAESEADSLLSVDRTQDLLRAAVEVSNDAFVLLRHVPAHDGVAAELVVTDCNAAAEGIFNRGRSELLGATWSTLAANHSSEDSERLLALLGTKMSFDEVQRIDVSTSDSMWWRRRVVAVADALVMTLRDVTADYRMSEQLRQSQKLEALGRLAGSVAHDFNNMLSAILGFTRLAQAQIPNDSPASADLAEVIAAGERSAALTHQLLAFSRRQVLEARVVDAAEELRSLAGLLKRLAGESIDLRLAVQGPASVRVDPSQLEQVVINLVVNARDAMPAGGTVHVGLRRVQLEAAQSATLSLWPGTYALLTVSDTGHGMNEQVKARIFEPFFTTKERGRGTGLGLSTVFGIVRQSGGQISVASKVDQGTTFSIYLPVTTEPITPMVETESNAVELRGRTALVVDDEPAVRALCARVLRDSGMTVLEARDGEQALQIDQDHAGTIDVLLTDVVMPRMNGRLVAQVITARRPMVRVLYMSGYTEDVMSEHGVDTRSSIVQKPVSAQGLVNAIRELLNEGAAS